MRARERERRGEQMEEDEEGSKRERHFRQRDRGRNSVVER